MNEVKREEFFNRILITSKTVFKNLKILSIKFFFLKKRLSNFLVKLAIYYLD